jgi:hypothetical protein
MAQVWTRIACNDQGLICRPLGQSIVLAPPFIMIKGQMDEIFDKLDCAPWTRCSVRWRERYIVGQGPCDPAGCRRRLRHVPYRRHRRSLRCGLCAGVLTQRHFISIRQSRLLLSRRAPQGSTERRLARQRPTSDRRRNTALRSSSRPDRCHRCRTGLPD